MDVFLQLLNLVFSCCMFCVYGRKSRTEKRESFSNQHDNRRNIVSDSDATNEMQTIELDRS